MTDPLARIAERVRPPAVAVDGHGDWAEAEHRLGTPLPEDFKQLVATYGRGDFWGALCLCTPFGDDNPVPLTADLLDDYGPLRDGHPEDYPYPLFPEPGGLLAWAVTESAAHVCWLTEGPPGSWPVVIWSRDDDYERFDCGAGAFLDGLTSRRITSELLHHEPELAPWFDPAVPLDHVYVRLGEGPRPYAERLQILREALGPTSDRGGYAYDGQRQDHFAVDGAGWLMTYESAYGHQLRVAFPPADSTEARRAVLAAVELMGCPVESADTIHGTSSWA
ncbi:MULTISPECIES: SMI1/KNR4 family protein [unclassified Streptomyces]|uniref:SMI1/KNR4 family protein n=1 Tax=Streptomyces sp. gb1(2016) TaxID=1828321 RepID=A0A652KUR6_9ACTN|nr:SMI1/KNR4 family protein [Streptomyces sp. gb1(2016)]TXS27583.1 SMI1/KNR4 family protein [Streptomyces sp. gb1(2016)]